MPDERTDAELVAGFRNGDLAAVDEIFRRYYDKLSSFAKAIAYGDLGAEDAVQIAFMKLVKEDSSWKPYQGSLLGWMATIIKHEFASAYRKEETAQNHLPFLASRTYDSLAPIQSPCDQHAPRWSDPVVCTEIIECLEDLSPTLAAFLLKPAGGFEDAARASLSRTRRRIAATLEINLSGHKLSRRIALELTLAVGCGKLRKELFE